MSAVLVAVLFVGCCWIRRDTVMWVLAGSKIPGLDTLEEWLSTQDIHFSRGRRDVGKLPL